jgi:hypothetical protein
MPAAVYPALQSAVLLCIDDNEDVLECEKSFLESFGQEVAIEMRRLRPQAPILMLSGAADIPVAFIAKDCLASQLLPTIAQLYGYGSTSQPSCDA